MKSPFTTPTGVHTSIRSPFFTSIVLVCALLFAVSANADTWYVKPTGNDANAGNSWAAAFLTVQKALASASSGDEIWVAAGTYYPDEGPGQTNDDRTSSFDMKAGVALYGGFPAVGNPNFGARNLSVHVTTLSGDLMQNDGANFANYGDNAIHVVQASGAGITASAILDGFTITAGNADGGGVSMVGGGMLISNTSPKLDSCLFTLNQAKRAGAMFIWSGPSASPTISHSTFSWNKAVGDGGGAVRCEGSAPTFASCTFSDNSAIISGGMDIVGTMATISNCAFLRNTATGYGGGLSIGATASTNIIDKCVFAGNQSAEGGGIKIIDYSATITSSLFLGNKSVGVGGGISTQGIAYTTTATNCTFSGNSSSSGGAIHTLSSTSVLLNSILWGNGNSTEIAHSGPGSTTATYSIIQGGYAGAGNLNVDPLFVSQPDHLTAPTTAGDLHLQICSPAIDAGTNAGAPANDLDGNARPFPATDTDMGAFEFQGLQQIPVALCQNVTVELNSMGNGGTSASSLDNGSTGCAPLVLTINGMNNLNFTCSDKGPNTYTLTVTDALGVTATCTAVVTVKDNVAPMALCKNVAINLNAAGNGNLSSAQVNNGSLDACGINSTAVSPSLFNCTNVGMNTVTLTVTDDSGNSKTCTAKVTVNDITPPAPLCQNLTVELNGAGMATVTPGQVDNNSSDACGIKSLGLSKTDFKCVDVGLHTVTLTVTDNNDNTNTCTATVTISDKTPPQAQCQNVMLDLNNSNNGVITPGQVDNGSSDNCGVKSLALSQDQFGCGDLGMHTVTLTVTDDNNNTNTCTAKVTVTNALAVFDVIGGSFCTDDVDATVSLSGSETGVSYQLKRNGINTGAPVPGTGSLLDFGMQPTGSYTVVASSDICGNTAEMNGPAQVVAGPCDISVPDHCDCEDPSGRTPVTLKVSALPGQTWTVKAVIGLYDTSSPALPAPQTPLAVDTPLTYIGGDMYTLNVYRLNNKGYYVVLTNGDSDRDIQVGNPSW